MIQGDALLLSAVSKSTSTDPKRSLRYSTAAPRSPVSVSPFDSEKRRGMIEGVCSVVSDPTLRDLAKTAILTAETPAEGLAQARALIGPELRRLHAELTTEGRTLEEEGCALKRQLNLITEMHDWMVKDVRLGTVGESILHKALSNLRYEPLTRTQPQTSDWQPGADYTIMLVQHDWAKAVSGKEADDGDIRLPYERTALELSISGKRVCALFDCEDGTPYRMTPLIELSSGWIYPGCFHVAGGYLVDGPLLDEPVKPGGNDFLSAIITQARAIAICLDADVVRADPIRAPTSLNAARIKQGKLPLYDYHVLSLANRRGAARLAPEHPGRRKRCHFRRGHWRHYESHKTWIRWMLVGDASLGFVDKDYRV